VKSPFLLIALFGNDVACVNGLWKRQPEEVVVFSSGVYLCLEVDSAVVFDEGQLGNHPIPDCVIKP